MKPTRHRADDGRPSPRHSPVDGRLSLIAGTSCRLQSLVPSIPSSSSHRLRVRQLLLLLLDQLSSVDTPKAMSALLPGRLKARFAPHLRLHVAMEGGSMAQDGLTRVRKGRFLLTLSADDDNTDLDPILPDRRTWGGIDYWAYWCSDVLVPPACCLDFSRKRFVPNWSVACLDRLQRHGFGVHCSRNHSDCLLWLPYLQRGYHLDRQDRYAASAFIVL